MRTVLNNIEKGDRRPLAIILIFSIAAVLATAACAVASSATLPSEFYRPGRYLPLRLEADRPGTQTFGGGGGVQAIEWNAPGPSSVVVPLLIFWDAPDHANANAFQPRPLSEADVDPPHLTDFWAAIDPRPGAGPSIDPDAHATAALWQPGRSSATRRWTLIAVAVVVLILGVARHADPKHATRWLTVAAAGVSVGIVWLYPSDTARRVLPAEGRPGWEWVWHSASGPRRVTETWTPGLRYVPRDGLEAMTLRPTLHCDAAGRPVAISVDVPAGERAVFIRPRVSASAE